MVLIVLPTVTISLIWTVITALIFLFNLLLVVSSINHLQWPVLLQDNLQVFVVVTQILILIAEILLIKRFISKWWDAAFRLNFIILLFNSVCTAIPLLINIRKIRLMLISFNILSNFYLPLLICLYFFMISSSSTMKRLTRRVFLTLFALFYRFSTIF